MYIAFITKQGFIHFTIIIFSKTRQNEFRGLEQLPTFLYRLTHLAISIKPIQVNTDFIVSLSKLILHNSMIVWKNKIQKYNNNRYTTIDL